VLSAVHQVLATSLSGTKVPDHNFDAHNLASGRYTAQIVVTYRSTDQTITYSYDAGTNQKGRLTSASDADHTLAWTYDTHGRVTGKGQALKYPVGVGRSGQQWFGTTRIASKHLKPGWKPPVSLRGKRSPDFYIEGGSPKNPMGAAALVLVDHELAIHGTNNPGSIGGFVSAGCIRMHNKDVMDLYGRVNVGTRVMFVK